ncbi:MAG TPA: YdbL family protein [Arenimonas sp.]|nr:YdbL family protein [Arenimonas sp.]
MRQRLAKSLRASAVLGSLLLLAACVTINVYFPAAEAEEAAKEFVDKVLGDEVEQANGENPQSSRSLRFDPLAFFIGSAHAQSADINIRTPAIQAIQDRMASRFRGQLQAHFDSGALGFGKDGLLVLRDASKVALKDRVSVNQLIAEDNRDRNAVYREIAVANGHPEWEAQIRDSFAKQWIASGRAGWWYQDAGGSWSQK